MKKVLFFVVAFGLGFAAHSLAEDPARVTGVGGVFIQSKDPVALKAWYKDHLGMPMDKYGTRFEWKTQEGHRGVTQWSVMPSGSKYFEPSTSTFMVNYRVSHLEALVARLKEDKVQVLDAVEATPYGKFVHVLDLDGNKVELWEPPDR